MIYKRDIIDNISTHLMHHCLLPILPSTVQEVLVSNNKKTLPVLRLKDQLKVYRYSYQITILRLL